MQSQTNQPILKRVFNLLSLGWYITILLSLIPVIIWLGLPGNLDQFKSFYGIMSAIGELTGLAGMILYALNLVYATRLKFLEPLFGGLNRVYITHHIIGGLALVLLAFHPLFLMLRTITTSVYESAMLLLPHDLGPLSALFNSQHEMHADVLQQWAIFLGTLAFFGMVILLILTFYIKLPYKLWLFTHKFLGLAFFLGGLHVLFINSDTSHSTLLKVYVLGFGIIGLMAFMYRTLFGRILIRKYFYLVDSVQTKAKSISEISLSPQSLPMSYKVGQFVFIRFFDNEDQGISSEWHPFSISSAPNDPQLKLTIKALGDFTKKIGFIRPGSRAEIEGAYGKFTYSNYKNHNQIWIAGGIGISPFISMAQDLKGDQTYRIDLYYCVRNADEIIDFDTLTEIANISGGQFRFIPYVSSVNGQISASKLEYYSGGITGKEFFLCGPPGMMKSLKNQLKKKGIPSSSIHSEEFSMS